MIDGVCVPGVSRRSSPERSIASGGGLGGAGGNQAVAGFQNLFMAMISAPSLCERNDATGMPSICAEMSGEAGESGRTDAARVLAGWDVVS